MRHILYVLDISEKKVIGSFEGPREHCKAEMLAQAHADKTGRSCAICRGILFFAKDREIDSDQWIDKNYY